MGESDSAQPMDESDSGANWPDNEPYDDPIAIDHCRKHHRDHRRLDTENQIYYAFEMVYVTRCGIRIGSSDSTCSCSDGGTCNHIRWLLKALRHAIADISGGKLDIHQQIYEAGLHNVCEKLSCPLLQGPSSDSRTTWTLEKLTEPDLPLL